MRGDPLSPTGSDHERCISIPKRLVSSNIIPTVEKIEDFIDFTFCVPQKLTQLSPGRGPDGPLYILKGHGLYFPRSIVKLSLKIDLV